MSARYLSIRTFLMTLAVYTFFGSCLYAAPPAAFNASFRGSDDVVLAEAPGVTVTERDMFLFSLIAETFDPRFVKDWKTLTQAEQQILRDNIDLFILFQYILEQAGPITKASGLELYRKAARINAGAAAQLLWADYIVRDEMHIFPEDVAYYYKQNQQMFSLQDVVTVRRLRVPLASAASKADRDAALARAEELRSRAAIEGGLAPLLEEDPSLLIDPPGRLVDITRSGMALDSQVVDVAFRLGVAQISAPIRTPGGYLLIEVLDRTVNEPVALRDVLPDIEGLLSVIFLPQQFDYMVERRLVKRNPINRAALIQFMPLDADILRVGNFALTLEEFQHLNREVIGEMPYTDLNIVAFKTIVTIIGEIATQELEEAGLLSDPFYRDALEMGGDTYRTLLYTRHARESMEPSEEELREYLETNRENVEPGPALVMWRYEMSLRDAELLGPGGVDAMRIIMEGYLKELIADAERQFEERLAIDPERGIAQPSQVVKNLRGPTDRRVTVAFEPEGWLTEKEARVRFGLPAGAVLAKGQFTDPMATLDGRAVSYFVSDIIEAPPISEEELLFRARQQYILEKSMAPFADRLQQARENGRLRYASEIQN